MMNTMNFEQIVLAHAEKYPIMQAQDYVKLAYQAAFGCGHMASGFENALVRVRSECAGDGCSARVEDIGNGYARLHLTGGEYPLSSETAARMFILSAEAAAEESKEAFFTLLKTLTDLSREHKIAPTEAEMNEKICFVQNNNFAPVSHTEVYRAAYHPAYRVVKAEYARRIPLISKLDELKRTKTGAIVSIDGMCASGKTTLSKLLGDILDAPVYHMDDFFLPPVKRTRERLSEAGGNVDYERFKKDVLNPLLLKKPFSFQPFDCSKMDFGEPILSQSAPLSIVEGSYACHPTLESDYDLKIFLSIDPELQLERIRARNGDRMLERFKNEWIPMENRYFEAFDIKQKADYRIHIQKETSLP